MAKNTTSIRLPEDLSKALDRIVAREGITRSQFIVQAVGQAIAEKEAWSPSFLKVIGTPRPDLEEPVRAMMRAIRSRRTRERAPRL